MNKTYDKEFNKEIERILNELYYNPITPNGADNRIVVETKRNYVQFLKEHDLATTLNSVGGNKYGLILQKNGYEVFEKYNGWADYKRKVIDFKSKSERAKILSQKYWWIPIVISVISLIIASFSLIINL